MCALSFCLMLVIDGLEFDMNYSDFVSFIYLFVFETNKCRVIQLFEYKCTNRVHYIVEIQPFKLIV